MNEQQVMDVLKKAVALVNEAEVEEDLRPVAFAKAVDLLSATSAEPVLTKDRVRETEQTGESGDLLDSIASRLKIRRQVVEEVYSIKDGNLEVLVPGGGLAKTKVGGTREIALLVVAGRQAAGLDDWTDQEEVKTVAEFYGRFDGPNFARAIQERSGLIRIGGTPRKRELQLRAAGWEEAKKLVMRLGGGDETSD